ncbi:type IV toxin-antitoxin system AbiEi family antitoxin domain-containing protein [Elusimicrobiota bacterium]
MHYKDVVNKAKIAPILRIEDICSRRNLLAHESIQLNRWVKEGKLIRLKRGLYALPESERKQLLSPLWLANQLYWPSYISLEYALSSYGIIPEAVGAFTSVTTLKTSHCGNALGTFGYKNIAMKYFFGFKNIQDGGGAQYWIADPEKAVLDFIHLSIPRGVRVNADLFIRNYRFQNLEKLQIKRFREYTARFSNERVQKAGRNLIGLIRSGK